MVIVEDHRLPLLTCKQYQVPHSLQCPPHIPYISPFLIPTLERLFKHQYHGVPPCFRQTGGVEDTVSLTLHPVQRVRGSQFLSPGSTLWLPGVLYISCNLSV